MRWLRHRYISVWGRTYINPMRTLKSAFRAASITLYLQTHLSSEQANTDGSSVDLLTAGIGNAIISYVPFWLNWVFAWLLLAMVFVAIMICLVAPQKAEALWKVTRKPNTRYQWVLSTSWLGLPHHKHLELWTLLYSLKANRNVVAANELFILREGLRYNAFLQA